MAKIMFEIECEEKFCGKCKRAERDTFRNVGSLLGYLEVYYCTLFHSQLEKHRKEIKRLPECIAAEKSLGDLLEEV